MSMNALTTSEKKTQESLNAVLQSLNSEGYRVPKTKPQHQDPDEAAPRKDAKNPRANKIRYSQGLGWCEETNTWWIHIRVGKKFCTEDTGQKSHANAQVWLNNYRKALSEETETGIIPGLTLTEGLKLWANAAPYDLTSDKRPSLERTLEVCQKFKHWVLPRLGHKKVKTITSQELQEVTNGYRSGEGPHRPHSETGVRNFLIDLNTVFRWLYKSGKVSSIPRLPAIPKVVPTDPVIVPFDRVWDLIERFDQLVGYDIYAMAYIRILAFCGVRTDNTRNLHKEQFNDDLTVFNTGITKNKCSYNLPVPAEVREFLEAVPNFHEPGLLLQGADGQKRSHGWCMKAFKQAAMDVGLTPKMAWHRLRATCATMLIRAGADMFILLKAMGWKTLEVALFYISTSTDEVAEVQRKAIAMLRASAISRPRPGFSGR